ncbi:MAG: DUF1007 family protein [Alphaproteobacteria bacterium]|nr:DUF1007 family protein [Alphaproteobacteria bacterium]
MPFRTFLTGFAALVTLWVTPAFAHPHAWIDLAVDVRFSEDGRVVGLAQTWIFDELYSVYATEGLDSDGDGALSSAELRPLLENNMRNLEFYDWFTKIRYDGADQDFTLSPEMTSRMRADGRLEMIFTVDLADALDPKAGPVDYALYDPSFYVEMTHLKAPDAIELAGGPAGCGYVKDTPEPNPQLIAAALALGPTETPDEDLGIHFAEWVSVSCP